MSAQNEIHPVKKPSDNGAFSPERITNLTLQLSSNMDKAIKDIQRITFQSRILSLNAKVEAARAGEIGSAFSVVATEMGSLSHEIENLVENLENKSSKDFKEIAGGELISVTGGLFAGLMLTYATNKLEMIPALLILLHGFLEMRGNISGSLSARLSAGLHVGAFKKYGKNGILKGNVIASFILVVFLSLFLGLLAYYVSMEFFGIINPNIIFVSLFAGRFVLPSLFKFAAASQELLFIASIGVAFLF